ncbi:hypothetical protein ACJMK2_042088 [Sinanodonta woodiana]|uniref:A-kinase anchor protein 7-like phosphoesterase domain-containing protein n=1 Tax=Sinanodonta woodiana TaxID=1069815 RepID=A0ABD3W840_SINWO
MFLSFFKRLFTIKTRTPGVFKKKTVHVLLSIKIGVILNRPICVYQPAPFGAYVPSVWHLNCIKYSMMASERSPPLGSFTVSAKIPKTSLPSPSSNKPPELPVSKESKNEELLVSTDVGFQRVPGINLDTVNQVDKLEKELLPKNADQKRKVSDEILDIKPDDSDVMMKFVVTGLPSSLELTKKSTVLPPSLLQGVTDFVRKTVVTDACKSEASGLVKQSDNHLITDIRDDFTCELSTSLGMLIGPSTENTDLESDKLFKDTTLVKISQSKEEHLIQSMQNKLTPSCCKGDTYLESDLNYSTRSPEIQWLQGMEVAAEMSQSSLSEQNDEDGFEIQWDKFAADVDELSTKKQKLSLEVTSENLFQDIDVQDLEKESSLVRTTKKQSSVIRTKKKESPVIRTKKKESPVIRTTKKESPVIGTTKKESPVIRTTKKESPVVRTTENKLGHLTDAFDISVLFSEKFDKEFKKYKQQEKKRAKEKARKQKRKEVQSSSKQSEEGEDEGSGKVTKKKKPMPNYFIAIQITNPVIHEALRKVQKRVVEQNKELLPALNPLPTLHLTVFVMYLASNEDIQRAKDALDECFKELKSQYMHNPLIVDIHGLGHFRNEVVFAKVSPEENVQKLQKIADVIETQFEAHAIPSVDKKGFKPHITIMKLSRAPKLRKKGIKKIETHLFQEFASSYFGIQEVSGLQLCAMLKPKAKSGYYQVEHENIFGETTNPSAADELLKMSYTIVQSCIKAAVYRLEQENLAPGTSQGVKIISHLDQKSEPSQNKELNLDQNEQIKDPNAAECAETQESKLIDDDKPKSSSDE